MTASSICGAKLRVGAMGKVQKNILRDTSSDIYAKK